MDTIRAITFIMALTLIGANIRWWRRKANRHFGEQAVPSLIYALLVGGFVILTQTTETDPVTLNGISLGIRNVSLIILIAYALMRKDHSQ